MFFLRGFSMFMCGFEDFKPKGIKKLEKRNNSLKKGQKI